MSDFFLNYEILPKKMAENRTVFWFIVTENVRHVVMFGCLYGSCVSHETRGVSTGAGARGKHITCLSTVSTVTTLVQTGETEDRYLMDSDKNSIIQFVDRKVQGWLGNSG